MDKVDKVRDQLGLRLRLLPLRGVEGRDTVPEEEVGVTVGPNECKQSTGLIWNTLQGLDRISIFVGLHNMEVVVVVVSSSNMEVGVDIAGSRAAVPKTAASGRQVLSLTGTAGSACVTSSSTAIVQSGRVGPWTNVTVGRYYLRTGPWKNVTVGRLVKRNENVSRSMNMMNRCKRNSSSNSNCSL